MKIELDENSQKYLSKILEDKIYEVTDLKELAIINKILKLLGHESKAWLEKYLDS